jgi:hypothetical protein
MQETILAEPSPSAKQGQPPLNIVVATLLTMGVVLMLSNLSVATSVVIGSFAGFCVAAWNWFRMGRRRKALIHVLIGLVVYFLIQVGYILLALLLRQLFPPSPPVEYEIPEIYPPGTRLLSAPEPNALIPLILLAYCAGVGVLVLLYLYQATARDVPKTEPLDDKSELKRLSTLLAVAAISSVTIFFAGVFALQVRTAQLQNHVYCELLQSGMTIPEVESALNEVGPHRQMWFQDTPYPSLSEKASYYRVVYWRNWRIELNYNLSLLLGYDTNDQLVWRGPSWYDTNNVPYQEGYDTIQSPWTFSQSVTPR